MKETNYSIQLITIDPKVPKKARPEKSARVLYSNQIEHLEDEALSQERCAFVRVPLWNNDFAVYNKSQLMSCRRLPSFYSTISSSQSSVSFSDLVAINCQILTEILKRKTGKTSFFSDVNQEAFRLVHGDADGFPGLVIDHYGALVVVQSTSAPGDFLLPVVSQALKTLAKNEHHENIPMLEKSTGQTRKMLGLAEKIHTFNGILPESVICSFAKLSMKFFPLKSQKTGLFLDQSLNLQMFQQLLSTPSFFAKEDRNQLTMLDLCSYAGAWSAAAARSGIQKFSLVDQDRSALELAELNITENANHREDTLAKLNNKSPKIQATLLNADLFESLQKLNHENQKFDIVVADPPAFAKSKKHIPEARRAYSRLTKLSANLVKTGGLFVVCSCSRNINETEFKELIFSQLAQDEKSEWQLICVGSQSPDHTVLANEYFAHYLKCFFLRKLKN